MATRYWLGRAMKRAQVNTITPTAANLATYTVTINTKTETYVSDSTATVAEITAGIVAACSASVHPEFQEINWIDSTTCVTATANTPGKPFTQTSSASAGTFVTATTVTNQSPSDVNDANNWSGGAVPISTDSIVLENSDVPLLYNLDALAAVNIVSFTVRATMTAGWALPTYTDTGYYEYRATTLQFATCTTAYIEQAPNLSAGSQKLSVGINACTCTVVGQGGGSIGQEVLWFSGTNASNAFEILGGSIAIAALSSDTATAATIKATANATVRCGPGATLTTIVATDTSLDARTNVTSLTIDGQSAVSLWEAMTVATLLVNAGQVIYNSSGTITTLTLLGPASIDFSQDRSARTITNKVVMYEGCTFLDPNSLVTLSGGYQVVQGRQQNCTLDFGVNRTYTVA